MSINVRAECHTDINTLMRIATYPSEPIAPQLFKFQSTQIGMKQRRENQSPPLRPKIVKELEQYPVEVLQTVLLILQLRQTPPSP